MTHNADITVAFIRFHTCQFNTVSITTLTTGNAQDVHYIRYIVDLPIMPDCNDYGVFLLLQQTVDSPDMYSGCD